jgi:hypothetical protein
MTTNTELLAKKLAEQNVKHFCAITDPNATTEEVCKAIFDLKNNVEKKKPIPLTTDQLKDM